METIAIHIKNNSGEPLVNSYLRADIWHDIILRPLERKIIPTGISIASTDRNFEVQVRSLPELVNNNGIFAFSDSITINNDRDEIQVLLINLSNEEFTIKRGMDIAQLVASRYALINWIDCKELPYIEKEWLIFTK
jgi:dUTP pyrophosphatase